MNLADGRGIAMRAALLQALAAAGVRGSTILTAAVSDFRPLMWYAPPIYPYNDLGGQIPSVFVGFDGLMHDKTYNLQEVYDQTLFHLAFSPVEVLARDRSCLTLPSAAFFLDKETARVVFSGPQVEPDAEAAGQDAAYTFALEFVAACGTAGIGEIYRDGDDFYIHNDKVHVGIKDGRVIDHSGHWDVDIAGYVDSYLTMTRGAGWETQTLDILDRLSFWFESLEDMPEGLEALPEALPYLRALSTPEELMRLEANVLRLDQKLDRTKTKQSKQARRLAPTDYIRRIEDCVGAMMDFRMTDAQRAMFMFEQLVPDVMNEGAFNSKLWDMNRPVRTWFTKDVAKINKALDKLRNRERK